MRDGPGQRPAEFLKSESRLVGQRIPAVPLSRWVMVKKEVLVGSKWAPTLGLQTPSMPKQATG